MSAAVNADSLSSEDTWTGRLMFPAGIAAGQESGQLLVPREPRLARIVDTPLVFMLSSEGYSLYWCQELMAVVFRGRAQARAVGFDSALAKAIEMCLDQSVQSLLIDLRECPDVAHPRSTEELGLEDFGRNVVVVHPQFGPQMLHDHVHLFGFGSFEDATRWLRTEMAGTRTANDPVISLARNADTKLIASNYAGCAHWLVHNRTLALIYSGQENDDESLAALLVAVSDFLEHLRAASVIVDLRHLLRMHTTLTQEISTAVQYLKSRGMNQFIVVGTQRAKQSADDPVEVYLEILSHVKGVQVSLVRTLEQALQLGRSPRTRRLSS